MLQWLSNHKTQVAAVAAATAVGLNHLAGFMPPPYDGLLTAVALGLAAVSGPAAQPASPATK